MSQDLARAIAFEKSLTATERLLLLSALADPSILSMSALQMSSTLAVNQSALSTAMARLKRMNCFRRSLVSKSLEINPVERWTILSK